MMPFQNSQQEEGEIIFSPPQKLAAVNSTNTVSVSLQNWFLASENIVSVQPADNIYQQDRNNVLQQAFYALGCARAGLDIMAATYQKKQLAFIKETILALEEELTKLRENLLRTEENSKLSFNQKLTLRAKAINLASRCAQGAVAVSSGAANYENHPAQRVYQRSLIIHCLRTNY